GIAGSERALVGITEDLAGDGAAAIPDPVGEIRLEQAGRGLAVRVDEQKPAVSRRGRPGVAGVVGGALGAGRDHAGAWPGSIECSGALLERIGRGPAGAVVGDD